MLTTAQLATLKADILASSDQAVVAARDAGNHTELARLYNAAASPVRKAWRENVSGRDLFDSMTITKFDTLAAGKRDAWKLMLDMGNVDATKLKIRKAVEDVWGATDCAAILQDCQENATRLEVLIGGTSVTTATVEGLKRDFVGTVTQDEIGRAMK